MPSWRSVARHSPRAYIVRMAIRPVAVPQTENWLRIARKVTANMAISGACVLGEWLDKAEEYEGLSGSDIVVLIYAAMEVERLRCEGLEAKRIRR